jgi:hypothetical protein
VGVVRVDGCGALMLSRAGRAVKVRSDEIRYANRLVDDVNRARFPKAPDPARMET